MPDPGDDPIEDDPGADPGAIDLADYMMIIEMHDASPDGQTEQARRQSEEWLAGADTEWIGPAPPQE